MERANKTARRNPAWYAAWLRNVRDAFVRRPTFAQDDLRAALASLPDLRATLKAAGVEARIHEGAIRTIEEAAEYAEAAIDGHAWDAAAVELDRMIDALAAIEAAFGRAARPRAPRVRRRATQTFLGAMVIGHHQRNPAWLAWRRLDLAIAMLAKARRSSDPTRRVWLIRTYANLDQLRPHVLSAVGTAHRDVKREVQRLLDEGKEAMDYMIASLEQGALSAAVIDLERFDASLRAMRNVVSRESPTYLPEPWPVRH